MKRGQVRGAVEGRRGYLGLALTASRPTRIKIQDEEAKCSRFDLLFCAWGKRGRGRGPRGGDRCHLTLENVEQGHYADKERAWSAGDAAEGRIIWLYCAWLEAE